MKNRYLALGDSHIRVFESPWFKWCFPLKTFQVSYVPGATAYGIHNFKSQTKAYYRFMQALEAYDYEKIYVTLGEVDISFTLWALAAREQKPIESYLEISVGRYLDFLRELVKYAPVVVISTPLPTVSELEICDDSVSGIRKQTGISQRERTALALDFNRKVKAFAEGEKDMCFIDMTPLVLDKKTRIVKQWMKNGNNRCDHHYRRWKYALLLIGKMMWRNR